MVCWVTTQADVQEARGRAADTASASSNQETE